MPNTLLSPGFSDLPTSLLDLFVDAFQGRMIHSRSYFLPLRPLRFQYLVYRIVASTILSCFEADAGLFKLLMKGIFDKNVDFLISNGTLRHTSLLTGNGNHGKQMITAKVMKNNQLSNHHPLDYKADTLATVRVCHAGTH